MVKILATGAAAVWAAEYITTTKFYTDATDAQTQKAYRYLAGAAAALGVHKFWPSGKASE